MIDLLIAIIGILATIFAAFLGAYLGTSGTEKLWRKQLDTQNKNMVISLKNEISDNAKNLGDTSTLISKTADDNGTYISITQFYPDTGLYHVFQKDISNLDSETSEKIYQYYHNLMNAEKNRKEIYNLKSSVSEYAEKQKQNLTIPQL